MEFVSQLRPKDEEKRIKDEKEAVGGLRRATRALKKLPEVRIAGQAVGEALDAHLEHDQVSRSGCVMRLTRRPRRPRSRMKIY